MIDRFIGSIHWEREREIGALNNRLRFCTLKVSCSICPSILCHLALSLDQSCRCTLPSCFAFFSETMGFHQLEDRCYPRVNIVYPMKEQYVYNTITIHHYQRNRPIIYPSLKFPSRVSLSRRYNLAIRISGKRPETHSTPPCPLYLSHFSLSTAITQKRRPLTQTHGQQHATISRTIFKYSTQQQQQQQPPPTLLCAYTRGLSPGSIHPGTNTDIYTYIYTHTHIYTRAHPHPRTLCPGRRGCAIT